MNEPRTGYRAALRYLVYALVGWFVASVFWRLASGHWPRSGILFTFPVAIILVTLIRLLIAYWEEKDGRPTPSDRPDR